MIKSFKLARLPWKMYEAEREETSIVHATFGNARLCHTRTRGGRADPDAFSFCTRPLLTDAAMAQDIMTRQFNAAAAAMTRQHAGLASAFAVMTPDGKVTVASIGGSPVVLLARGPELGESFCRRLDRRPCAEFLPAAQSFTLADFVPQGWESMLLVGGKAVAKLGEDAAFYVDLLDSTPRYADRTDIEHLSRSLLQQAEMLPGLNRPVFHIARLPAHLSASVAIGICEP